MNAAFVLLFAYFSLYQTDSSVEQPVDIVSADRFIAEAYEAIREAEDAGSDVSALIDSFNLAQNYVHDARSGTFESCNSEEDCIRRSYLIFDSIITEAESLREQASRDRSFNQTLVFAVYAPSAAIASSVIFYLLTHKSKKSLLKSNPGIQPRKTGGKI